MATKVHHVKCNKTLYTIQNYNYGKSHGHTDNQVKANASCYKSIMKSIKICCTTSAIDGSYTSVNDNDYDHIQLC